MTPHPVVAVLLALCSATGYAAGAALQRRETARAGGAGPDFFRALARRGWWWAGVATMTVGAGVHVVALGFGSVTLVQPVGVTSLILALPLDAWLEHRRIGAGEWAAATVLVAGLGGLLVLAPHEAHPTVPGAPVVLGAAAVAVGVVALLVLVSARAPVVPRAVIRAAASGVCAGATSGLVRLTIRLVDTGRSGVLVAIVIAVAVVLPVAAVLLLQTAYRDGGLDTGLATQTTVDPAIAASIGIAVLGERFTAGALGASLAGVSAVVAVVGLVTLVRAGPTPPGPGGGPSPSMPPRSDPATTPSGIRSP